MTAKQQDDEALPIYSSPESFGTWLKYVRQLSGLSQQEAAKAAGVSFDAVKRLERGQLVGSAHLLAWLSWLIDYPAMTEATEMQQELERWPSKLLAVGDFVRDRGLAKQPPKGKAMRAKRLLEIEQAAKQRIPLVPLRKRRIVKKAR